MSKAYLRKKYFGQSSSIKILKQLGVYMRRKNILSKKYIFGKSINW